MTDIVALLLLIAVAGPCGGTTTPEVERCLAADLARADAELNRYYTAAVARLAKDQQTVGITHLRASERAWIVYRDAECNAVYEWWKGGTIRGAMALGCQMRITRARTMTIWRNWLTYADSTPPLLPQPLDGD
ncbi:MULTISPECIES: lysozyme inhibitor LprI family protein [unclassified Sphingomonas]|uniref:lysozyme inhibitor LprI family protein n=1 Tax=unclassified Sphingomonas TaxID=196159 RepID=UPI00226A68B3|nr:MULTISPECIES: lysozyme inhibitor LprI family protein [unclassified Sphingomonas]